MTDLNKCNCGGTYQYNHLATVLRRNALFQGFYYYCDKCGTEMYIPKNWKGFVRNE